MGMELSDSPRVVNRLSFGKPFVGGVVALAVAVLLSGCGWLGPEQTAEDAAVVKERAEAVRASRPEQPGFRALREARDPYLALQATAVETSRLPDELLAGNGVVVPVGDYPGDEVLAGRIGEAAGIHVRLTGAAGNSGESGVQGSWFEQAADDLTLREGLWVGPLDGLLDRWTGASGYEWTWSSETETVEVVRWKTQIFQVNALLGETTYRARIATSGGGGDETSGSSGQSIRTSMEYKPWEDIEKELAALAGEKGESNVVVSPSAATVTVTGRPALVERVRRFLAHLNANVLRPITLSAHLYAVRLDEGADLDLGLSGAIPEIFGSNLQLNARAGTLSIVKPTTVAHSSLDATLKALRSVGTTTRVLSVDLPALNGQAVEFFDVYDHRYLKEIETSVDEGLLNVKLKPGEVWSGFGLSYVGRIVGNDGVLARITVTIQDAPTFTVFGAAANQIQLPSAGRRAVVVTQHIERGAVLLLSGFSDRQATEKRAGTFHEDFPLPEGERRRSLDKVETVLLVTAEVGAPMGIAEFPGAAGVGG